MILDLIAGIIVAYGLYQGFTKGLIKTVFATLSLVVAIVAAMKLSPIVITALENMTNIHRGITFVLGFVITFIGVMALIRFIGNKLEKAAKSMNIGLLDKLLGAGLMGLFYAILISFAVSLVDKIDLISEEQKAQSFSYSLLEPLPRMTQDIGQSLQPVFKEFWNKLIDVMDSVKEKGQEIQSNQSEG